MDTALESGNNGEAEVTVEPPLIDQRKKLATWLSEKANEGRVVRTRLKASERVIARVTDGIYRQPASALRELISNAWDADANNVTILTDAPRFSRIYVRDDGLGMSYETLARLLHSIGGSAKRREEGQKLGVTSPSDPDRTRGGRPIIGKIGIGLFSVSQLSRRFRIVTKVKGEDYRLVADVVLRTYSEDDDEDATHEGDDRFINGEVYIVREATDDVDAHGTDVILDDVKPRVRDLLRSAGRWRLIEEKEEAEARGDHETAVNIRVEEPRYHVGWIENLQLTDSDTVVLSRPPRLPWPTTAPAETRMSLLMDAVEGEFSRTERPDLANTLDSYLEMLWTLSLSVPVPYVDRHPFDLTQDMGFRLFWIANDGKRQATEIEMAPGETVRDAVSREVAGSPVLEDGIDASAGRFSVRIDGIELKRPIRFNFVQTEKRGLSSSLLFVGKYEPNLERISAAQRGGDLALEGYLFWNGRIIPKESNGILIRIRGAAGALFDPTFFKYQVSEQTRLRQITSELFIRRGLDAALNIDRESFNYSHPHVQLVAAWVHRAIRQLTNKHKDISARHRAARKVEEADAAHDAITQHAETVWTQQQGAEPLPEVAFVRDSAEAQQSRVAGQIAFERSALPSLTLGGEAQRTERERKTAALAQVLTAYRVFEDRPYDEQQALIGAILKIFF